MFAVRSHNNYSITRSAEFAFGTYSLLWIYTNK